MEVSVTTCRRKALEMAATVFNLAAMGVNKPGDGHPDFFLDSKRCRKSTVDSAGLLKLFRSAMAVHLGPSRPNIL